MPTDFHIFNIICSEGFFNNQPEITWGYHGEIIWNTTGNNMRIWGLYNGQIMGISLAEIPSQGAASLQLFESDMPEAV